MRIDAERILDIDFGGETWTPAVGSALANLGSKNFWVIPAQANLQANGSGVQLLRTNIPVLDSYEIFGMAHCDKGATIKLQWGFGHSTAFSNIPGTSGQSVLGAVQPVAYDIAEADITIATDGSYIEAGGTIIGPIAVKGEYLQVYALNTGIVTSKFRIALWKRKR